MVKRRKALEDGTSSSVVEAASISVSGRSRIDGARRKRLTRAQVMKMLSLREEETSGSSMSSGRSSSGPGGSESEKPEAGIYEGGIEISKKFLSSGRTGRRNALHDILGQHAGTGTGDLPAQLEALTTDAEPRNRGDDRNQPSTSKDHTG